ncbi:hypothetical protein PL321_10870 [Caloramator sp. mosi_1]|uniref:hypothetical protein n=1 Tax=Caloramator sp. mosi_1 TaxID=3023090 RepID=UPI00235E9162|nr:hypothetical protein [Caloramator sp. mosi_1]WDC83279.1 hypothetical protein PL321_10870 [Caloramator sp. mosi_1]
MYWSDIILVHWWHHPKISKFLFNLPQIPIRLVIWTHVSNLTVPALNPQILLNVTRVMFTTEASYEASVFENISDKVLKEKTDVVYGCPGLDEFKEIKYNRYNKHEKFNIGYVGYIDFSKMHPQFVEFCREINIQNSKFILVGDAPAKEIINYQIKQKI